MFIKTGKIDMDKYIACKKKIASRGADELTSKMIEFLDSRVK